MLYGYGGHILRVDLSQRRIKREKSDPRYMIKAIGGRGLNSLRLADELADVMFVLVCLANQTGIDLEQAFQKNLEKKTARDFERHQQNDKLRY